ncbi:VOC family protein [Oscillatoria sp. FACHB-1406]|uniref:VOC family protein n=1 Tax=Oscillatoria sp. FACHB-1406 TaxID=2692846 RepID=UPI001685D788|nr:VOC family protein [Oscillatoria sp. FACHB-1406]MBD2580317.1 VOC family protein [Oscillatoria sp. FACHB-1406]
MQIQQCLHTAILVADIARAEQFYGKILGLNKVDRGLNYAGVWYQIGDYQLHLIADENAKTEPDNTEKWGRNPHIALGVVDLNVAIATLSQHHYPFQMSSSGRSSLFVRDPDGNVLELSQLQKA